MPVVRIGSSLALATHLAGCFVMRMPPSIPAVDKPALAPDAFLELHTGQRNETRSYTEKSDVCSKGGRDCLEVRTQKHKNVRVNVAAATLDGTPISIGKVAAAASPEYVTDTEKARDLTSSCKRGRLTMMAGGVALSASYFLLQVGFGSDERRPGYAAAGIAALGAGIVGMALGRFAFGGQHCDEAEQLYKKWGPVYADADATTVKNRSAEMLEQLVDKFNRDREAARERSAGAPAADAPVEE